MRYSLLAGGKRMRPALFLMTDDFLQNSFSNQHSLSAIKASLALECVHTYSLIHDDLPAMDDDSTRRGKPTCHIKYGESTAILAGDALLTEAFSLLGSIENKNACEMILLLANAAGAAGMVGGQELDVASNKNVTLKSLEHTHQLKTGKLIEASILMATCLHQHTFAKPFLKVYGQKIGLAFQVVDDILDVTQTSKQLGKDALSDQKNNKSTYVSLMGLSKAQHYAETLVNDALKQLDILFSKQKSFKSQYLKVFAKYILSRQN